MDNKQKIIDVLEKYWRSSAEMNGISEVYFPEVVDEIDVLYHRDCGKCIYLVHTPDSIDCCIGCKWSSQDRYKEADK